MKPCVSATALVVLVGVSWFACSSGNQAPAGTGRGGAGGSDHGGTTGSAGTGGGGGGATGAAGIGGAAGDRPSGGSGGSAGLNCPASAPKGGDVCNAIGDCACKTIPCGTTGYPPAPLTCMPGQICIEHQSGNLWYECRPDPCSPSAQSCACAGTLCGANSTCSFQGAMMICGCANGCA